ncbi:MAG: CPBP family intramembrane metalloprotease [Myxococcales bacterium]|nr:CPBP family intramembrane metalloprotease [Myxococcales bacterium]
MRLELRRYGRELGGEPAVVILGASALLVISHYQANTSYFRTLFGARFDAHPAAPLLPYFWWFGASLFLYLVIPLALSYATRGSFTRAYGMGLGDAKAGLAISGLFLLVMLPAAYVASRSQAFAGHYPLAGQAAFTLQLGGGKPALSLGLFLIYEAAYLSYFVGWEFLFRGWMLNGLLPRFGKAGAVLIQASPFAVMHLGKPELEALGSVLAGVALGVLALRTRSFWYGALLHGVVAVWMDVLESWAYLFPS